MSVTSALELSTQALATRRLTTLVTQDKITQPLRVALFNRSLREWATPTDEGLAYLVTCESCVSVWAGAAVVALSQSRTGRLLVRSLALSQVSKMLDSASVD